MDPNLSLQIRLADYGRSAQRHASVRPFAGYAPVSTTDQNPDAVNAVQRAFRHVKRPLPGYSGAAATGNGHPTRG